MTNESRFMRELRFRQSRLIHQRKQDMNMHNAASLDNDDVELHIDNSKVMALCNELDDNEDASDSRLQSIAQKASRASQLSQHLIQIETRDEGDDIDFIEEIAESISAQPSRLFCEELAREVDHSVPQNGIAKDEFDEMLDEALRDDDIESQNDESESASSSSSSGSDNCDREDEDCESLNSSIVSDDLRLILSESGVSASSYQVASFPFPGDHVINLGPNTSNRTHLHKKILITQPFHPRDDASDDVVSVNDESRSRHPVDDDDDEYEYEYFPEPTVVDMLPGLNAALDALAERFSFGPCARSDDGVLTKTYRNTTSQLADSAREAPPESANP